MAKKTSKTRRTRPAQLLSGPFQRLIQLETGGAILLLLMTIIALTWANSPWGESYVRFWQTPLSIGIGDHPLTLSLAGWVNDALMAVFFFVVGMEIKREIVLGELSSCNAQCFRSWPLSVAWWFRQRSTRAFMPVALPLRAGESPWQRISRLPSPR